MHCLQFTRLTDKELHNAKAQWLRTLIIGVLKVEILSQSCLLHDFSPSTVRSEMGIIILKDNLCQSISDERWLLCLAESEPACVHAATDCVYRAHAVVYNYSTVISSGESFEKII